MARPRYHNRVRRVLPQWWSLTILVVLALLAGVASLPGFAPYNHATFTSDVGASVHPGNAVRSAGAPVPQSPVSMGSTGDNTLYESSTGAISNGAGAHFFAGINGRGEHRRGVIKFDIADNIPAGSAIDSVSLTLHMSKTNAVVGSRTVELRRILADWGEGTSNAPFNEGGGTASSAGDATWVHTFFNTGTWSTQGGDFSGTVSASRSVDGIGFYTWGPTAQMVSDVQRWLDDPSRNFGWLLKGDKTQRSTKRFDSRENGTAANRPVLTVGFTPPSVLQFSAATYSVSESVATATIAVTRTGSSSGDVSVDFAASDGSAIAGRDYTPTSGTITFGDLETGDKFFTIEIKDDVMAEGDETVNITLSNPSGGAIVGSPGAAVLTITENDRISGDVNGDGFVDILDLGIVAAEFGPPPFGDSRADTNNDGLAGIFDLTLVARNLGRLAPQPLRAMRVERAFPNLTFQRLTNLVQPDDGRDRIFVTEQRGRIRLFLDDPQVPGAGLFMDISNRVSVASNEEGLLGLAFDPEYSNNGYFYVYYSAASPRRSVLSRFSVSTGNADVADPQSESIILEIPQPFRNHNGGQIAFGPDGYLYVGLGDGGGSGGDPPGHGQNRGTPLGSILRIDVGAASGDKNYRIPPDNPFVGVDGVREEIWAYGLRNPWRFSFDKHTGTLWVGDVGESLWEEIDLVGKGLNYGWNIMEGDDCFSPAIGCDQTGLEPPVVEYSHSEGCSVTGGYVFRGSGIPSLLGAYVYGDFCSGKIWGLRYVGGRLTEHMLLVDSELSITSFGQDRALNLYILSRNDGIYRMSPAD